MKQIMKRLLCILLACVLAVQPVYADNGGWSTEDMLTGFHTIGDYVYYFSEAETNEWRYGQMVTGTVEVYGGVYTFDSEGHMTSIYGGLE